MPNNPRTGYNNLTTEIYSSGTTRIIDVDGSLANVTHIRFNTYYPGGIYGSASCFVPRNITRSWLVQLDYRIVFRNGHTIVWEGKITGLNYINGVEEGIEIVATGQYGMLLGRRTWNKPWADQRIDTATWPPNNTFQIDKFTQDRQNRIMVIPKDGVSFANGDKTEFAQYTAPTGETCKRITYTYDMQEGAQAWKLALYNNTAAADEASSVITASGSGTKDITFGTPSQVLIFYLTSQAAQTGIGDGTIYAKISGVTLYTETGSINLTAIAQDVRGHITDFNSDESGLVSNTFSLVPFISNGQEYLSTALQRAASFGDGTFQAWNVSVNHSEFAVTPDGKPTLYCTQIPQMTNYEYGLRIDEPNLVPPINIVYDSSNISNWIGVRYRDELNNKDVFITPDDNSALKDTTSITAYGQKDSIVEAGQASSTTATNLGRRYLASFKDPRFYVNGPINVVGYLRRKTGDLQPACQITAAERIKIENYQTDFVGSETGLTFLITNVDYNDDSETASISTGSPDNLAIYLAQRSLLDDRKLG